MVTFVQFMCTCTTLLGLVGCIQLDDFYPFGAAAGDLELARADDGFSAPLRLKEPFPFYDREESTLYVNTNGLLSFGAPSSMYSQDPFPLVSQSAPSGETFKVIAPFWGDVDNELPSSGQIWYRQTTADVPLLTRAKQEISKHFLLYPDVDLRDFNPSLVVVVTWHSVGYYERHLDKTNTFQCVLVADGKISFAIFLYAEGEIEWTTADSGGGTNGLGGVPAQAGFNFGDGLRSYSLPLSQSSQIVDIDQLPGNTRERGIWIFRVDRNEINSGECSNDGSINLLSNSGNILGGSSIVVSGPCFDDYKQVFCHFENSLGGIPLEAVVLDSHRVLCIVPQLMSVGRSAFKLLLIDSNDITIESQERNFFSLPSSQAHQVNYFNRNIIFEAGSVVELTWTETDVFSEEEQDAYNINITLYGLIRQGNAASWTKIIQLATNVSNSGQTNVTLPTLELYHNESAYLVIAFQIQFNPLPLTNQSYDLLSIPVGIWSKESYYSYEGRPSRERCVAWASYIQARVMEQQRINELPPCPCNEDQAEAPNSGFHRVHHQEFFNPQATVCYYQSTPTNTTAARQCCYDNMGGLIYGAPGGGHSDFVSPFSDPHSPHLLQLLHFEIDTVPFLDCCKAEESLCLEYYKFRPSTMPSCQHNKLDPAFVYGDPHFVTLDGYQYTFNGKGEFFLIDTNNKSFTLQGRMTEVTTAGMPPAATVLSALVAKQLDSDIVQFSISRRGIDVIVNGELIELSIGSKIPVWNAVISKYGELNYGVRFSSGVNIEMKKEMDYLSAVIVSLPKNFMNITMGLLGYFNGNQTDDLFVPAPGLDPLPLDSDLIDIHEGFGLHWLISRPENSLFTYQSHESYLDYFDPTFIANARPTFDSQELKEQATLLCDGDKFCLYDVAVTGRLEVGNLTKRTSQRRMELIELSRPINCDPPCQNGACVHNNTCNCHAGYSGPTCSIKNLVVGCTENPCVNRGTCRKLGVDSICQCPTFTSGLNCEQKEPLKISLINSSPRLWNGTIITDFLVNREEGQFTVTCDLDRQRETDCTDGYVRYDFVPRGNHILKLTARSENRERHIVRRKVYVGYEGDDFCEVHLINDGVTVDGRNVKVQFTGTRLAISYYTCQLDGNPFVRCRSPYRIEDLQPGEHRIKIAPVCTSPDSRPYRTTTSFIIE